MDRARPDLLAAIESGDPDMDREHRHLLGLVERFLSAARSGARDAARGALDAFHEGLREHFEHERVSMERSAYPERRAHEDAHAQFSRDVASLLARAAADPCSPVVRVWVESRLVSWFRLHVRASDTPLARHLATAATAPAAAREG